jgi:cytochrome c oxidase subunit IV
MASVRLYALIYVLLLVLAATKFLFFQFFDYELAVTGTLGAASLKTVLIAGFYQHLAHEPRSLTQLMLLTLFLFLLLMSAASYSIL